MTSSEPLPPVLVNKWNTRSAIWNYFGYEPDEDGQPKNPTQPRCKRCYQVVLTKAGNTSNLATHLMYRHTDLYKEFKEGDISGSCDDDRVGWAKTDNMTDSEVIQAMVMSFRLSELQALLNYAGKSKSGRKHQLQRRALDLLRLNSEDIKIKIRELNHEMGRRVMLPSSVAEGEGPRRSVRKPDWMTNNNGDEESSSEGRESPNSANRRTRSTRSRVSYVEPEEDEASEVLSESSSSSLSLDRPNDEDEEDTYDQPSGEEVEVESDGDSSEEDEDSDSSISADSNPQQSPIPNSHYSSPNILKKTPRKKTLSPPISSNTAAEKGVISNINSVSIKNNDIYLPQEVVSVSDSDSKHEGGRLLYPPCPDVQLIPLPFYRIEAVLLKPSSLNPSNVARFQAQNFTFHLTPSQASAIAGSSYRDEHGKLEYKNQIQMRFCLNETSCPQDDNFPASICVIVNGRPQSLPNIIPTNKPGVGPKRPPKPINITGNCKLSATLPNYLNVTWTVEAGKGFCVAIYYVEKLSSTSLIKILKEKGNRHPAYTKAIIKDKLNDRDCEIATTSCKVTLTCPLGKMRMSLPCRATTCDHLQCFDARLYIQMNERKPKWICPVCNKVALYENLMVDGYFFEVLNDPKLGSGENEIVLKNDATWEPLPAKTEEDKTPKAPRPLPQPVAPSANGNGSSNNTPSFETFDVVDDDEEESSDKSAQIIHKPAEEKVVECITLDDSDEEASSVQPAKKIRLDSSAEETKSKESPALICLSEDED